MQAGRVLWTLLALPTLMLQLMLMSACPPGEMDGPPGPCVEHVDCPTPQLCLDGVCTEPGGAGCDVDADCPDDLRCIDTGRCRANVECVSNAECCAPGQACDSTCQDYTCVGDACTAGQTQPCFVGCHRGEQPCESGLWGVCDAPPVLDEEICDDQIDNDCNSQTDEGCGSCDPGASRTVSCGDFCGFAEDTCGPGGDWIESNICEGEGVCTPGTDEQTECGNCASQVRTCNNTCQWNDWTECLGPPDTCSPGAMETQGCGNCGGQLRSCASGCSWSEWSVCDEAAGCLPGDEQTQACGSCGIKTSTCDASCGWSPFGFCVDSGVCTPGAMETEDCGDCGERNRACGNGCQWDAWSGCENEGVCSPASSTTESCGPGTAVGICEDGERTRTCNSQCQWNTPGQCFGATYPGFEICGNGVDEDCTGADSTLPDQYEANGSCQTCSYLGQDPDGLTLYPTYDNLSDFSDWFCFFGDDNADPTENVDVSVSNLASGMDLDIYLYRGGTDPNSEDCTAASQLTFSAAAGNGGTESMNYGEGFGSSDDGYYYIEVRTFGDPSCYAPYTLTVTGLR